MARHHSDSTRSQLRYESTTEEISPASCVCSCSFLSQYSKAGAEGSKAMEMYLASSWVRSTSLSGTFLRMENPSTGSTKCSPSMDTARPTRAGISQVDLCVTLYKVVPNSGSRLDASKNSSWQRSGFRPLSSLCTWIRSASHAFSSFWSDEWITDCGR